MSTGSDWIGWYFSPPDERLGYGDRRPIRVGVTHEVLGPPVLCLWGLHASPTVMDALTYAPSALLWRVRLSGQIVHGLDKSCATERTYLARVDAGDMLRDFARRCALSVIHVWNAPAVVQEYLATGAEELRAAAREASRYARTCAAVWCAADAAYFATLDDALAAAWGSAKATADIAEWRAAARDEKKQMLEEMALAAVQEASAGEVYAYATHGGWRGYAYDELVELQPNPNEMED